MAIAPLAACLCLRRGEQSMALTRLPAQPHSRRLSAQSHTSHVRNPYRRRRGARRAWNRCSPTIFGCRASDGDPSWCPHHRSLPLARRAGLSANPPVDSRANAIRTHLSDNLPGRQRSASAFVNSSLWKTYDSVQKAGNRYFFRKRLPSRNSRASTSVRVRTERIACCSTRTTGHGKLHRGETVARIADGRSCSMKSNKEENGRNLRVAGNRNTTMLADVLATGLSAGLAFAPDGNSFCYVTSRWIRIGRSIAPRIATFWAPVRTKTKRFSVRAQNQSALATKVASTVLFQTFAGRTLFVSARKPLTRNRTVPSETRP